MTNANSLQANCQFGIWDWDWCIIWILENV